MIDIKENYDITKLTTFRFPVKAKSFITVDTIEDLLEVKIAETEKIIILGFGSNLFFSEDFFDGIVIKFTKNGWEKNFENEDYVLIKVFSGTSWDNFVEEMIKNKWYGLENLSRIPSGVGASAIQNIGAYGVEVKDFIETVSGVDLIKKEKKIFKNKDCLFSYRDSIFKKKEFKNFLITDIVFKLNKNFKPNVSYPALKERFEKGVNSAQEIRDFLVNLRDHKFPDWNKTGNVGSFFKNPSISKDIFKKIKANFPDIPFFLNEKDESIKIPAGWLIEKAGLKGLTEKKVGISKEHGLILLNFGGNAKDMLFLINKIKKTIEEKFNIELQEEAIII